MRMIQATEAKTHLAELLRKVEQGESIAITRHGKTIAHLVPADVQDRIQRKKAVDEFRRRRSQLSDVSISLEEILAWRHEGHRF